MNKHAFQAIKLQFQHISEGRKQLFSNIFQVPNTFFKQFLTESLRLQIIITKIYCLRSVSLELCFKNYKE